VRNLVVTVAIIFAAGASPRLQNTDWFQWRGPNRDGISKETGLLKQWPAGGPPLVWKASGAGNGYSTFSVSQGRLFTMGAKDRTEFIFAFDAATGKQIWATQNGRRFSNDRGDGPRGTPTIDGERLYALGGSGDRVTNAVEVYDVAADRWSPANGMPTPRDQLAAVAFEGRVWAIGGRSSFLGTQYANVEIYDPATDSWRTGAPLPSARGGLAAAALGDRIFVFGGEPPLRI